MSVKAVFKKASELDTKQRKELFDIFERYYAGTTWSQFNDDLSEKDSVILLLDRKTGKFCGFSTLVSQRMKVSGKSLICVFSGDTVLEKKYWGSSALGIAFLSYLFLLKFKNPLEPVYWMLISKGYKTYLLMANNFGTHFPNNQVPTPPLEKKVMDEFYSAKFGQRYEAQSGIIRFHDCNNACRVAENIAPVTSNMREANPLIRFFVDRNPHWQQGDELAGIAKMTLNMPFQYASKKWAGKMRNAQKNIILQAPMTPQESESRNGVAPESQNAEAYAR